ncbi:MAG TPA: DUF5522 domain-containing protein [Chryseolinea sp.]
MSGHDKPDSTLYYIENGLIVFTEAYHLKRGYCCKSGCRHCPYDRKAGRSGRSKPDRQGVGEE